MSQSDIGVDQIVSLSRVMQLIRRCEEQLARSHQQGLIHGACHTYVGQEAIAAGVCAHLRPDDAVFSTHRGHGHALAKGLSPEALIAELFGRESGCSHGRGGSMHLFAPEIGLMGTSGIVGPCILQAVGAGYSFQLAKTDRVAVAFFGDGAVNNGAFHEGLNLAAIWKLPVLFVCENNQYATEVAFTDSCGNPDVAARASSYGLAGTLVDGNDVIAVFQAARDAVARARRGEGATLLECRTYRTRAHAEGMGDFTYRSREEVESWKARCPIQRLRQSALDETQLAEREGNRLREQLDAIDVEVAALIREATRTAENAPWPGPSTATCHIYTDSAPLAPPPLPGTRETTFSQATLEALRHEMEHEPLLFVLGEGIGRRGGNFRTTAGLYELFGPERLRDTPICERGFVGLACGAAMAGARPVVDFMFLDFINDAFGEIVNQIAKMRYMSSGRLRMPVVLRGCIGIGHSAATHHSSNAYSIYAHIPGLRVVVPSTPFDAKGLFLHALRCGDPVLFLEHRELLASRAPVPEGPYEIEFGRAAVLREGADLTVVALALMAHRAMAAAERLAQHGHSIEVIDPRTISPLDTDTILASVARTGSLLIVDEDFAPCGIGSEIAARVIEAGFDDLDAPIKRLQGTFTPTPYSPTLERAIVPQIEDIERAILELING